MTIICKDAEIHVGDIGTVLQFQCLDQNENPIDLTNVISVTLKCRLPDKSVKTFPMVVNSPPTSGIVQYTTVAGDLPIAGIYRTQVYINFGTTSSFDSNIDEFRVWPNL